MIYGEVEVGLKMEKLPVLCHMESKELVAFMYFGIYSILY